MEIGVLNLSIEDWIKRMSRSNATVTLKNGAQVLVTGRESQITEQINAARDEGTHLIRLELDRFPTGQYASIDPNEVAMIVGDAW
jgi:hypothetical protein